MVHAAVVVQSPRPIDGRARPGDRRRREAALLLGTLLALALAPALAPALAAQPAVEEVERRPADGEQCIVCKGSIVDQELVELRYKGRICTVKTAMLDEFLADPELYFRSMEAHGALFDETSLPSATRAATPSRFSLYLGLYVLAGLVGGALCGYLAIGKGLAALPWFWAGFIGNAAALVVLLAVPRGTVTVAATAAPLACPHCGFPNHPTAAHCSGCDRGLTPLAQAESARASASASVGASS